MQRFLKVIFAFLISVIFVSNVGAASVCSTSEQAELRTAAGNIRAMNQEMEEDLDPSIYGFPDAGDETTEIDPPKVNYFDISVSNITDKFYIEVTNDYDKERVRYNNSNSTDDIITFPWRNLEQVTNFTIKVYTSENTGCPNELMRTITLKLPRFNEYYDYALCTDAPEFNLCQKYVTFDYVEQINFLEQITEYLTNKRNQGINANEYDNSLWKRIMDFIADNKYYFIGGGAALVIVAGVAVVVIVKRKRSLDL